MFIYIYLLYVYIIYIYIHGESFVIEKKEIGNFQ